YRNIDLACFDVGHCDRRLNIEIDVWALAMEFAQSVNQPIAGKRRHDAEPKTLRCCDRKTFRGKRKLGKCVPDYLEIARTVHRQLHRTPRPHEKLRVEAFFQLPKSLTDRARRQKEFLGGLGKTPMPRNSFECSELVEWR